MIPPRIKNIAFNLLPSHSYHWVVDRLISLQLHRPIQVQDLMITFGILLAAMTRRHIWFYSSSIKAFLFFEQIELLEQNSENNLKILQFPWPPCLLLYHDQYKTHVLRLALFGSLGTFFSRKTTENTGSPPRNTFSFRVRNFQEPTIIP